MNNVTCEQQAALTVVGRYFWLETLPDTDGLDEGLGLGVLLGRGTVHAKWRT
jgi:hypothetical protein